MSEIQGKFGNRSKMKRLEIILRGMARFVAMAAIVLVVTRSGYAADRVPVCVSIVPQKYFVQQIGGDLVDVQVMVLPGASPATYEPKPRQMADLLKVRIYFAVGVPFEDAWLGKISAVNPNMKVVHTEQGIEKIPMAVFHLHNEEDEQAEAKEHYEDAGPGGGEAHVHNDGLDPHIWLSPPLVKRQAQNILRALQAIDPANANVYETNCRRFISEIDALDDQLKAIFGGRQGDARFMVFHPSWGYFARAYGLEQIPIEIEGKDPKPAQLKALIEHAREEKIRVIFVQPQFSTKSAELIAREIGGRVAFADPLAEDWMANLRSVAGDFEAALK